MRCARRIVACESASARRLLAEAARSELAGSLIVHADRAPSPRQMLANEVHDLLQHFVEAFVGQQDLASRLEKAENRQLRRAIEEGPAGGIGHSQYPARSFARVQFDRRAYGPIGLVQGVREFAEVDAGDDAGRSRFVTEDRLGGRCAANSGSRNSR